MKWNELVEARRKLLNLSQQDLADRLGVTQGAVGNWLNNRRKGDLSTIMKIFHALEMIEVTFNSNSGNVVCDYESTHNNVSPRIKIKGTLTFKSETSGEFEALDERYFTFYSNSPNTYAYQVLGSKLEPRIVSGEYIVVDPSAKLQNYDEVLIKLKNNKYMIRVLLTGRGDEWRYADPNTMNQDTDFNPSEIDTMEYISAIVKPQRTVEMKKSRDTND
ncbi:hypothetical protein BKK54_03220 [Rodentibacter genomosp. 1]|uniref:HTH cro/C1-type domain-containing protein n=1 Tax=Rodentibacter genomosp. 1 TaxID=1908264 RepID=A0A1V3J7V7_9PAST|nr:helix-turn-helix domain-containing protein [Rodentibacter genomosp. 1]OOF51435.1 hypothetical protein BKK54_03220 [Rodentibacter genomosp. 1]